MEMQMEPEQGAGEGDTRAGDAIRFIAPEEMVVQSAAGIRRDLLLLLESCEGRVLEVDLSSVSEIDTAGMQILLSLRNSLRRKGGRLRLISHTPAVLSLMDLYGLVGYFGNRIVLSPSERGRYGFRYGMKKREGGME